MRRFILMMLIGIMSFGFSSCATSQTVYADYHKVYFDHVVYGHVISENYVYDGTYSYHILGAIPVNTYWELYPCSWEVYVYNKNMIRIKLYEYTRRSIYYNRTHHNYYKFDDRHRPPYRPQHYNHRPPMNRPDVVHPGHKPDVIHRPNGNTYRPNTINHNGNGYRPNTGNMRGGATPHSSRGNHGGQSQMGGRR